MEYHSRFGDEITFIPGGFFQPMYNPRERTRQDLHEALQRVSDMVGGGYRPRSVLAGFLDAASLKYLAEKENIHVCQGNIWSQYSIDNGDGDGSVCYPYYPSTEHFCKPGQGAADFIDCVNLDGWTCDFLAAPRGSPAVSIAGWAWDQSKRSSPTARSGVSARCSTRRAFISIEGSSSTVLPG